jgi:N-acyl-D-amino-acid deacylase
VGSRRGPLDLLGFIDETAAAGGRMFGLSHSRGISVMMSFLSRMPFDTLPVWSDVRALPHAEQVHALQDPAIRRKLVEAAQGSDYPQAIGAEVPKPDYAIMRVLDNLVSLNPTVAELAAAQGIDPVEVIIERAVATDLRQFFVQPLGPNSEDELLEMLRHPRAIMTFSDAGAHVSQVSDSSIQTYMLSHWVRERGDFTLEEAVRMMTLAPATAWNFADRGLVREGFVADLNIFDPDTVAPQMPTIEHDYPAGARRIVQKANGFLATIVGGQVLFRDGIHTGALPGQLIRGPLGRA